MNEDSAPRTESLIISSSFLVTLNHSHDFNCLCADHTPIYVTNRSLSLLSTLYTQCLSQSFFTLVDGNSILLVAQGNTLTSSFTLPFHASRPIGQEILLIWPFKYIQSLVTSHHLHCHHLSLSGHHLLLGLLTSCPNGSLLLPLHSLVCLQHGFRVIL